MKMYSVNGRLFWFNEGEQPEGAIEVNKAKDKEPEAKAVEPKNKARKVSKK